MQQQQQQPQLQKQQWASASASDQISGFKHEIAPMQQQQHKRIQREEDKMEDFVSQVRV
jgi:hypothetical protein